MTALVTTKKVLTSIVLTQKYHCSQNAVLGSQLHCPYVEDGLMSSLLILRDYCSLSIQCAKEMD